MMSGSRRKASGVITLHAGSPASNAQGSRAAVFVPAAGAEAVARGALVEGEVGGVGQPSRDLALVFAQLVPDLQRPSAAARAAPFALRAGRVVVAFHARHLAPDVCG